VSKYPEKKYQKMVTGGQLCKWPKVIPPLTDEQKQIKDEWMKYWHEVLPNKYGIIEKFNHGFPVKVSPWDETSQINTLEIGAGLGEHINYENLDGQQYHVLELRENMADTLRERFRSVSVVVGDIQKQTVFSSDFFDRVIAIHVLEHLPDLPSALHEIHRVMKKDGSFTTVIPCEGGLAYKLARSISAKRLFKKKFMMDYDWLIETEHINHPDEIIHELEKEFLIVKKVFFPLVVPFVFCNLCIGLKMIKK
jgi:ubiquinone/menaquinone biosynthesis C-methylase UbiE